MSIIIPVIKIYKMLQKMYKDSVQTCIIYFIDIILEKKGVYIGLIQDINFQSISLGLG